MRSVESPIITPIGTFTPCDDSDAIAFITWGERNGALMPAVYTINGYRVCASLDPAGKHGSYIQHVSVTKDRLPIDSAEAIKIASALLPSVFAWDVNQQKATHCWERES